MKRNLPILILIFTLGSAQNRLSFTVNPGYSLYNSENLMKVTSNKKVGWFPGLSLTFENENLFGHHLSFEYNYTHRKLKDVIQFLVTSEKGPEPIGTIGSDLILDLNNFDLGFILKLNEFIRFSGGPTVSYVNRSFVIDNLFSSANTQERMQNSLEDRLASICIGFNCAVDYIVPMSIEEKHFFFLTRLKLRYVHSVWFDARGRNLDQYFQSFLFSQLNVGIGYSF